MKKNKFLAGLAVLWVVLAMGQAACAGIDPLWDKYHAIWEEQKNANASQPEAVYPGRVIGDWSVYPEKLFLENWSVRGSTYEILSAENKDLARLIYGLALYTKDLDPSVTLERFEKGAQGFHYSLDQILGWGNAVLAGEALLTTNEELSLLAWLVEDGVLAIRDGKLVPGGAMTHVLGAAPGRKRSVGLNLNHERLHVLWDEDQAFRDKYVELWNTLTSEEKESVYNQLSGYDRSNEMGIVEEWAVRQNETEKIGL